MARPKKESIASIVDRFVAEMPPQDLIIMGAGAFAGMNGYTPLTMLIKTMGAGVDWATEDVPTAINELRTKIEKDPWKWLTATITAPIPTLIASWIEEEGKTTYAPPTPSDEEQAHKEAVIAKLAMACIGLIEAYAITRPGVVLGLAKTASDTAVGLAQAAGEAVPF